MSGIFTLNVFSLPQMQMQPPVLFRPLFAGTIKQPATDDGGLSGIPASTSSARPMSTSDCDRCDPNNATMTVPAALNAFVFNSSFTTPDKCGIFEGRFNKGPGQGMDWKLFDRSGWIIGWSKGGYKLVARHDTPLTARGYMFASTKNKTLYCVNLDMSASWATENPPISMTLIRCTSAKTWTMQMRGCRGNGCGIFQNWTLAVNEDATTSPFLKRVVAAQRGESPSASSGGVPATLVIGGGSNIPAPAAPVTGDIYLTPPPPPTIIAPIPLSQTAGGSSSNLWLWLGGGVLVAGLGFAGWRLLRK